MKRTALCIFCIVLFLLAVAPVLAQSATPEATAAAPSGNVTVNVEPAQPLGGTNGLAVIAGALVVFVVGIFTGRQLGLDKSATTALQQVQTNTQALAEIRNIYATANDHVQQIVDMFKTVVTAISPLTPITTDDELAKLLATITDKDAAKAALLVVKAQQVAPLSPQAERDMEHG